MRPANTAVILRAAVLAPFLAGLAGASGSTHDDSDYILSRATLAMGGRESLAGVKGLQVTGQVQAGSRKSTRRSYLDFAGGRFRVDSETDARARRLIDDGKFVTLRPARGALTTLEAGLAQEARADFFVRTYEVFTFPAPRADVASLPDRKREGYKDHVVQVKFGRAAPRVLVFDGETYFLKAIETGPDSARTILELDSYRDINDVQYPFHERLTRPDGQVEEFDVTEVRLNPSFADTVFHPRPQSRRAPRRPSH